VEQVSAGIDLAIAVDAATIDVETALLDDALGITTRLPEPRLHDQARVCHDAPVTGLLLLAHEVDLYFLCVGEMISELGFVHVKDTIKL